MKSKSKKVNNMFFINEEDEIYVKSLKKFKKPKLGKKLAENWFSLLTNPEKQKFSKFFLELYESIIVFRKNNFKEEFGFMDIENSFVRKSSCLIKDKTYYYIKFTKLRSYEIIYHKDKNVIINWFNFLKKHCILLKFSKKFKTIKVLGKGNFAKVYLVKNIEDENEYAVKVFNKKNVLKDKNEKLSLLNEIKIMRAVEHVRILKLMELYEGESHIYLLQKLCKGSNLLDHLIEKGYQPELKSLTILMQILEGLSYLHNNNIIHRDMKPDNILFQNNKSIDIVIVDLGFATYLDEYDKLFSKCGTPGYIAPEILENKEYGFKVDIFSAGVIFYMTLTGRMPFSGNTYKEIVAKNVECKPNFNFEEFDIEVSNETLDLLKKMLTKDPEKRISAKDALLHSTFRRILSKSPLIIRQYFDAQDIINNKKITFKKKTDNYIKKFGVRIQDLSPGPLSEKNVDTSFEFEKNVNQTIG